jgi:hypothetical protein
METKRPLTPNPVTRFDCRSRVFAVVTSPFHFKVGDGSNPRKRVVISYNNMVSWAQGGWRHRGFFMRTDAAARYS